MGSEAFTQFGAKLATLRLARGMKQRALAERVPMDPTYLNKVEKGKRPPPTAEKVLALARELRLASEELRQLLDLAGYSSVVAPSSAGPTYSAPTLTRKPESWYQELSPLIDALAPAQQRQFVEAIRNLAQMFGSQTETGTPEPQAEEHNVT